MLKIDIVKKKISVIILNRTSGCAIVQNAKQAMPIHISAKEVNHEEKVGKRIVVSGNGRNTGCRLRQ